VLRTDETGAVEIIAEGSALRLRTANHAGDTDLIRGPT
jgi:hypothetical protein